MKTAQGAISVDVSKFNSAIDSAKARLSSFGNSLSVVGNTAKVAWKAFDAVAGVSQRISTIAQGGRDLQAIFNTLPTIIGRVSTAFSQLKSFASQAGAVISRIPIAFRVIGVSAVVAGASIYGVNKALQGIIGVTKSALSGITSLASGLANMAKNATASVGGAVSSAFRGFLSLLKPIGVAVGALGISFGALDRFFKIGIVSAIELGDEMRNLAGRTGASIPFLYDLQKLLKDSGISSMSGAVALQNMQRALTGINADGEPTNDMLARLNLNVDELMQMTPEQQFIKIGNAISKLSTSAQQTAASFSIFGRAGASLKGVFKEAGFAELGTKQSQLGQSLARNADNFAKISSKLRDSGSFFRGFFVEMAGAVAPSILELFKLFEGGDILAGFGAKLGQQIRFGIEVLTGAFKSGMITDLLKSAFETSVILLKDLLERAFKFAASYLNLLLSTDALEGLASGLIDVFTGFAKVVGSMLLRAFETPIAYFQAGMEFAVVQTTRGVAVMFSKLAPILNIANGLVTGLANTVDYFSGLIKSFQEKDYSVLEKTIDRMELRMSNFLSGFENKLVDASSGETFRDILDKNLQTGVSFGTAESGINSRNTDKAFEQIANGAKKAINGVRSGIDALTSANVSLGVRGKDANNALADLSGKLSAIAIAGKPSGKAVGEIAGAEVLGAKVKSMSGGKASEGISSLQRIGGGGGVFSGWNPKKSAEEQKAETQRTNELLYEQGQILKNPRTGEYVAPRPTMSILI
jgi:hypothetical protein